MKNVLLIGLGRFGRHIAKQLNQLGHEIMAVDWNEERVDKALPFVTNAQIGDSTNAEFLQSLGIGNYDICFVTIGGSFQNSLETTSLLKELGAKLVISRAERDVQEKFLLRNGADKVVYPEKQVAKWASIRYTDDHILDYMEVDASHAIFEVEVPEEWVGKTVGELDIRKRYNINILAVKNEGEFGIAISPDTYFEENHKLLVLGEYRALQKCFRIYNIVAIMELFVFYGIRSIIKSSITDKVTAEASKTDFQIAVGIIAVITLMLMFYAMKCYIKLRIKDYSMFLVLGMKKKAVSSFIII